MPNKDLSYLILSFFVNAFYFECNNFWGLKQKQIFLPLHPASPPTAITVHIPVYPSLVFLKTSDQLIYILDNNLDLYGELDGGLDDGLCAGLDGELDG